LLQEEDELELELELLFIVGVLVALEDGAF
jgi:hypothetical protein